MDAALAELDEDFAAIHAPIGWPSIPPEQLLRALLLQAFFTVSSERQLMEQLEHNLLFRWFVGLGIDDPVWDVTLTPAQLAMLIEALDWRRAVLPEDPPRRSGT